MTDIDQQYLTKKQFRRAQALTIARELLKDRDDVLPKTRGLEDLLTIADFILSGPEPVEPSPDVSGIVFGFGSGVLPCRFECCESPDQGGKDAPAESEPSEHVEYETGSPEYYEAMARIANDLFGRMRTAGGDK